MKRLLFAFSLVCFSHSTALAVPGASQTQKYEFIQRYEYNKFLEGLPESARDSRGNVDKTSRAYKSHAAKWRKGSGARLEEAKQAWEAEQVRQQKKEAGLWANKARSDQSTKLNEITAKYEAQIPDSSRLPDGRPDRNDPLFQKIEKQWSRDMELTRKEFSANDTRWADHQKVVANLQEKNPRWKAYQQEALKNQQQIEEWKKDPAVWEQKKEIAASMRTDTSPMKNSGSAPKNVKSDMDFSLTDEAMFQDYIDEQNRVRQARGEKPLTVEYSDDRITIKDLDSVNWRPLPGEALGSSSYEAHVAKASSMNSDMLSTTGALHDTTGGLLGVKDPKGIPIGHANKFADGLAAGAKDVMKSNLGTIAKSVYKSGNAVNTASQNKAFFATAEDLKNHKTPTEALKVFGYPPKLKEKAVTSFIGEAKTEMAKAYAEGAKLGEEIDQKKKREVDTLMSQADKLESQGKSSEASALREKASKLHSERIAVKQSNQASVRELIARDPNFASQLTGGPDLKEVKSGDGATIGFRDARTGSMYSPSEARELAGTKERGKLTELITGKGGIIDTAKNGKVISNISSSGAKVGKLLDLAENAEKGAKLAASEEREGDSGLKTWGKATIYGLAYNTGFPDMVEANFQALKSAGGEYSKLYQEKAKTGEKPSIWDVMKISGKAGASFVWDVGKAITVGAITGPTEYVSGKLEEWTRDPADEVAVEQAYAQQDKLDIKKIKLAKLELAKAKQELEERERALEAKLAGSTITTSRDGVPTREDYHRDLAPDEEFEFTEPPQPAEGAGAASGQDQEFDEFEFDDVAPSIAYSVKSGIAAENNRNFANQMADVRSKEGSIREQKYAEQRALQQAGEEMFLALGELQAQHYANMAASKKRPPKPPAPSRSPTQNNYQPQIAGQVGGSPGYPILDPYVAKAQQQGARQRVPTTSRSRNSGTQMNRDRVWNTNQNTQSPTAGAGKGSRQNRAPSSKSSGPKYVVYEATVEGVRFAKSGLLVAEAGKSSMRYDKLGFYCLGHTNPKLSQLSPVSREYPSREEAIAAYRSKLSGVKKTTGRFCSWYTTSSGDVFVHSELVK